MSFTIVLRVLWNGGVARIAVEESRITKAKLLVLRESLNDYDLRDIGVTYLRRERVLNSPLQENNEALCPTKRR